MKKIFKYFYLILLISIILLNYNSVNANTIVKDAINSSNETMDDLMQSSSNITMESEEINDKIKEEKTDNSGQNLQKKSIEANTKSVKSNRTIKDGIYKIESILNNKPAFDIKDGSKEDGALIQLWQYVNAKQQKFEIIYGTDGYYTIKSIYSKKVLAVRNKDIIQKTEKGTDDEKWIITVESNGIYSITSKANGLNIDIPDYKAVNGQKLQMHYNNNTTAQKFKITEQDKKLQEGIYKIETVLKNKPAFDITDGSFLDKTPIQLWDYVSAEQQKFEVTLNEDGYYTIKSVYTGKVLAVSTKQVGNGTEVIQKREQGTDDEKWSINYQDGNEYSINSKINNLSIDIPDYKAVNGQKLQMHYSNGTTAQRFIFYKENAESNRINNGVYTINSKPANGKSFDITDGAKEDGVPIQLWDYVGANQQKFSFEYLDDGYYKIISMYSGKALTIESRDGSVVNGSNVVQKDYIGSDLQKWTLKAKNEGKYLIVSKNSNYTLEVQGTKDGDKVKIKNITGNDSQIFSFTSKRSVKPSKTISDGIYRIETILNYKPAFDITDGSNKDGTPIQLWDYVGADQQKYEVTCDNEGYYQIKSIYTKKVLAIENDKASNGTRIIQKTSNGTDDEKWIIYDEGKGYYSINSKIGNSCISVPNNNAVNGQKVQLYDWNNSNNQKFIFTPEKVGKIIEDGVYRIDMFTKNALSFDIDAGKRNNGANLQLWDWAGEKSYQQQFKINYNQSTGTYTIYNINSGKVLDVKNAGYTNGTDVWQYESNGTDAQKWIIEENTDGSYSIKSKLNGLYIDIQNGKLSNGSNVQLYTKNGTDAQKFNLIKQTEKTIRYLEDGIYRIATKYNNNLVFDITDGSKKPGAQIQLWEYVNSTQEEFKIYYEDGYYYICSLYSNQVIQAGQKNEIITQAIKNTNSDLQKWIMQPNNGAYNIISKGTGLYIDITDGNYKNGNKIQTYYGNGNIAQLFEFKDVAVVIDESKYPGIKERINQLKEQHPNWKFEILYTGLDFHTAVQSEYEYAGKQGNLVYTPTYKGAWIAPYPYVSGPWASASYQGIAYFMDPRNFLNEVDAFQFVDLGNYASSGATLGSIQYQVNGTFLNNYAEDVRKACENTNINPYYIIARLFQEQGKNGSDTIYMDGGDGNLYFNPFNIGAQVGNDVATALDRAKREGWNTMQKGIEGGIRVIKKGYIDIHQNTLYLNKFDVNPASGGGFYNHQYMQNLSAAYSEARIFRKAYADTNTLDNEIKFIVPVYENMPTTPSKQPTGEGEQVNHDKGPLSVKVVDTDMGLALRTEASTSGTLIERMPTGTILLSVERLANGWHKVITPSGNTGYCSNSNLQIIVDDANCNDRVMVVTNDKIGANVRIGPGKDYEIIRTVLENSTGTRIVTNRYKDDQYWWDEVIFDDGTKGFVATNFLKKIN